MKKPSEGRRRVIIEGVSPEIDGGRFRIKRAVGEEVVVEADIFADGHDVLGAALLYRRAGAPTWNEAPMRPLGNDRWRGAFAVAELKRYEYTLRAWVDRFATWRRDLAKKIDADLDVSVDLQVGAEVIADTCRRVAKEDAERLQTWLRMLRESGGEAQQSQVALDEDLAAIMTRQVDLSRRALLAADSPDRQHAPQGEEQSV
jgi:starch synthase (maltosyl-transferring)